MTMKERITSILFLSLFVLMLGINCIQFTWDIPSHSEIALSIDWESESESEDTENGAEDPDKIVSNALFEFDTIKINSAPKGMHKNLHPVHQEIHLPPPERI